MLFSGKSITSLPGKYRRGAPARTSHFTRMYRHSDMRANMNNLEIINNSEVLQKMNLTAETAGYYRPVTNFSRSVQHLKNKGEFSTLPYCNMDYRDETFKATRRSDRYSEAYSISQFPTLLSFPKGSFVKCQGYRQPVPFSLLLPSGHSVYIPFQRCSPHR